MASMTDGYLPTAHLETLDPSNSHASTLKMNATPSHSSKNDDGAQTRLPPPSTRST